MPTYHYTCQNCGESIDQLQKITDEPLKECPSCGSFALQRGVGGGVGLSFTGSGFYITDYGKKEQSPDSPKESSSNGSSGCCPCGKNKPCS